MTRLTYTGGLDTLSLNDIEDPAAPPIFEEILHTGESYNIPDHPMVDAWRARGLLVEASPDNDTSRGPRRARKGDQTQTEQAGAAAALSASSDTAKE